MSVRKMLTIGVLVCLGAFWVPILQSGTTEAQGGPPVRTDVLVLVNSASADYSDFQHLVQPYLDNFGVPYVVLDIATSQIPADIGDYSLLIVGHRQIDVDGAYLDSAEQDAIAAAVNQGSGLVNMDNDLWTSAGAPRYQFVQSVFDFGRGGATTGSGVAFSPTQATTHYITARHSAADTMDTDTMRLAGITLPATAAAVAVSGDQPFVTVASLGSGHAVQWGSYDWMSHAVRGPVYGLDDLVWRSLVWAAHKPFVMQVLPPIVTMRVDDEKGPFDWIHTANDFGFKPWAGLFFEQVGAAEAADLSALTNSGQATASIHAFGDAGTDVTWFYFNHAGGQDFSDDTIMSNFALGTQWHQEHNIPISRFVLPHYYEFGSNVFSYLSDWGVEYIGTLQDPGQTYYSTTWLEGGPYRRFESGASDSSAPLYYADFLSVPGHPELDGRFFNCVTEIRDDNGYEWYPNNDVTATIGHGTRQLTRAFDSRVLATLFTHGEHIQSITPSNWRDIMQGINANIADYGPISMTMDTACQYMRALSTSSISLGTYDSGAPSVRTTLVGSTDIATRVSLFTSNGDQIDERLVDVPAFTGSIEVVTQLGSSGGDVTPPQILDVAAGQVTASSASVAWTTDEPASSQVEYGTTIAYGSATTLDTTLATSHSQPLTGLSPSTVYHYRVLSRDGAGNLATGMDATFTTATTPAPSLTIDCWDDASQSPVLATTTNPGDINLSDGRWTEFLYTRGRSFPTLVAGADEYENNSLPPMRFFTSGIANGTYDVYANLYTEDAGRNMRYFWGYSSSDTKHYYIDTVGGSGGATQHTEYRLGSVTVTDGSFSLYAQDADLLSGDYPVFGWAWIRLVPTGGDVTPPQISNVAAGQVTASAATVTWTTDEPASSQVEYGTTIAYGSATTLDATLATSHSQPLTGLSPSTVYHYRVLSRDGAGNLATGMDATFTTAAAPTPSLTINDVSVTEGNSGSVNAVFTVSLSAASGLPVSVAYATANGSATAGSDYTAKTGTLNFAPGVTTQTVSVAVLGDTVAEPNETFAVNLSGAVNATLADSQGLGTILDNDAVPSLTINDVSVTEGNSGSVNAVFTVSLSAASGLPVSVAYATANGSATAGSDYTAKTGTLNFAPGVTTQTVSVAVLGDTVAEPNETFAVNLSGAVNATLADSQGLGTILDNDAVPTSITINCWDDASQSPVLATTTNPGDINLSDGRWTEFLYTRGRSFPTLVAGADEYENNSLPPMRFFTSGIANGTYDVYANLYTEDAGRNMRYFWGYSSSDTKHYSIDAVGGSGGATQHAEYRLGSVTVTDGSFSLYAQDADLLSGDYPVFGWAWIRLVPTGGDVTPPQISNVAAGQVTASAATVTWTTDEPASSQVEYGTTIAYGSATTLDATLATSHSQPLTGLSPSTVYHYRVLSRDGAGNLATGMDATFTTAAAPTPSLTINDVSVTEGNSGSVNAVFTVSLSAASGLPVSVAYATANGSATAGSDYTAKTGTLNFAPGVTTQTVSVAVLGDTVAEPNETFAVNLSGAVNATLADSQGLGTILDNDAVPSLTINDVSVTEGNSGSVNAVFTVSLSAASGLPVSVAYATANGSATAGSDYTAKTGTLNFAPGVTTQTVSVAVLGDTVAEPNETFAVNLSGAVNATLADSQGLGTILDNDAVPTSITINCWDDASQSPVLATTTNPGDINLSDGRWTEFLYTRGRSFPTLVAGADEYENNSLPPMRFFTSGIANGTYDVYANLYTEDAGRNMRYFWGYSSSDTKHYSIDAVGGSGGATQHAEYRLGSVTITDGNFSLYAQDADLLSGDYPVFGWAWIRLVPVG